eukprot:GHVU01047272.1.p1 GENE.GHVU01047272.1~~GHVU01047272.1.p1  ORF type:complete len:267 (+),score=23.13 GHVU01047272.1:167-967(+)
MLRADPLLIAVHVAKLTTDIIVMMEGLAGTLRGSEVAVVQSRKSRRLDFPSELQSLRIGLLMLGPQMTRKRCEILQSRLLEGGVGECEVIPKGACSQGCAMPSLTHVVVATPPAGGGVSASIARFLGMPQHDVAKSFAQHSDGEQEGDSNSEGAPSLVNVEWVMRIIKEQKFISEDEFEVHLDGTHACEHAVSAQSDSSPPAVDSRSAVSGAPASEYGGSETLYTEAGERTSAAAHVLETPTASETCNLELISVRRAEERVVSVAT